MRTFRFKYIFRVDRFFSSPFRGCPTSNILLFLISFFFGENPAQSQRVYHMNVDNGLCTNSLTELTLDRQGNMWIGSYSGIMKFTGTHVRCIKKIGKSSDAISGEEIHSMSEDHCGFIWVGTTAGLDKINPVTYEVVHYPIRSPFEGSAFVGYIYAVYADSYDYIWLSTDVAMFRLDAHTGDYKPIPVGKDGQSISHFSVSYNGFRETKEGLWISTADGMAFYNYKTQIFYHRHHNPENKNIFKTPKKSGNAHSDVELDEDGKLWWILEHEHLASYDISRDQIDTFPFDKEPGTWPCCYTIGIDARQNVWVGTRHGGVFVFDITSKTFRSLQDDGINRLIQSDYIYSLESGPDGKMFVAHDNGLDIVDLYDISLREWKLSDQPDFLNLKYQGGDMSFNHDESQIYIPFYKRGFFSFDVFTNDIIQYDATGAEQGATPYVRDFDGKQYISVNGNMQEIKTEGGRMENTSIYLFPKELNLIKGAVVWLYRESTDSYYLKKSSGRIIHVLGDSVINLTRGYGFEPNICLSPDSAHISFLTTNLNLIRLNLKSRSGDTIWLQQLLDKKDFSFANPRQMVDDGKFIWMTGQNGMLRYDLDHKSISHFGVNEGLSHSFTFSLVLDREQNIWVGSLGGIDKYDPESGRFVSQSKINDNAYMNAFGNAICSSKGELYFQHGNRLIRIRPHSVNQKDGVQLSTQLDVVRVNGKSIDWKNTDQMSRLTSHENRLMFVFDILHYEDDQLISFQYRLNGKEWIDNGQRNEVNLDGLAPDKYMLELRGGIGALDDSIPSVLVPFRIYPPWWKQWWFMITVFFITVMLIWMYFRSRIDKYRKELKVARQISDLESRALRAQMNPHFVFNSLNAIQECIVTGRIEEAYTYLSKFSRLLRMVLEHSDVAEISLEEELEVLDLYISLEKLRFRNDMHYHFQLAGDIDPEEITIAPMLIQPHLENAIWHGLRHKEGQKNLRLSIRENPDGYLEVMIEDDGIGRRQASVIRDKSISSNPHKSKGRQISENRMELLRMTYPLTFMVITDLFDAQGEAEGTKVTLRIPIM